MKLLIVATTHFISGDIMYCFVGYWQKLNGTVTEKTFVESTVCRDISQERWQVLLVKLKSANCSFQWIYPFFTRTCTRRFTVISQWWTTVTVSWKQNAPERILTQSCWAEHSNSEFWVCAFIHLATGVPQKKVKWNE